MSADGLYYDAEGFAITLGYERHGPVSPLRDAAAAALLALDPPEGFFNISANQHQSRHDAARGKLKAILASADTHPKDGDVKQAPLVSGAVDAEGSETPGKGRP